MEFSRRKITMAVLAGMFALAFIPCIAYASTTYYTGVYYDTGNHFSDIKYGYRTNMSRDNTSYQVIGLGYAKPVTRQVGAGAIKMHTTLNRRTSANAAWAFAGEDWQTNSNALPAGQALATHAYSSLTGYYTYAAETVNSFRNPDTLAYENFTCSLAYTF